MLEILDKRVIKKDYLVNNCAGKRVLNVGYLGREKRVKLHRILSVIKLHIREKCFLEEIKRCCYLPCSLVITQQ